jgi:ATP-dependent Lhr-like helicase
MPSDAVGEPFIDRCRTRREARARGRAGAYTRGPVSPRDPLSLFHPPTRRWFADAFGAPTAAQAAAWPEIAAGRSTLLLAPTGSGKTLAAFLAAIDRLMFAPEPAAERRCRVIYVSPLKALAADVERNLQRPLAGIAAVAEQAGAAFRRPTIGVRSGDTTQAERAQLRRAPPDIYITTPESLYLLLTSSARDGLLGVESVIVDEIHAVADQARGPPVPHARAALRPAPPPRPVGGAAAADRAVGDAAAARGGRAPARWRGGRRRRRVAAAAGDHRGAAGAQGVGADDRGAG